MVKIFLVFCFVAMWAMVNGERSLLDYPTPTGQCTIDLYMNLIGCIDFVSNGSKVANPSIGCCNGIEEIVKVAPNCVCQAFNFAKDSGIDVNMTKAQQLPSLCRLSTDIHCDVPSKPPTPSPLAPPKSSPAPTPSPLSPPKSSPAPTPSPVIPPKPSPPASSPAQSLSSGATTFSISSAALLVSLAIATCSYL
ncbi:non-specific lipid transfer protein GPI-anchored 11-like [Magnolia sinica]|uniref:non-specific lipid transfer protein GPI-anchored 11-like n=1 Tax=Magnolia sinica TaxID=86752 RepID=UPI00265B0960|nr:non-specific lipid transfer protein GPI-anchored 11-like [Magnolia sinica]